MSRLKVAGECWVVLEQNNGDTAAKKLRKKILDKHFKGSSKITISYYPALDGWIKLEYEDEDHLWFLVRQLALKDRGIHVQVTKQIKYVEDKTGRLNWTALPRVVNVWREPSNNEYLRYAILNEWDKVPSDRQEYLKSWISDDTPLVQQLKSQYCASTNRGEHEQIA